MFKSQGDCRHKNAQDDHVLEDSVAADDIAELTNGVIRTKDEKRAAFTCSDLFSGLRSKADLDDLIAIVME